ncbi:ankyrin repeat domain-containing protein 40-like [Stylophora pistillata]|uniref:ankyrin repeat domain-containing protein 40-like n=1 Tax=Stylophora pistillata TaxID=50429 RepID=UPI000C03CA50|nr:ankyrin repeat domain-containing protein 40-like [Stylophora pistillata]
MEAKVNLEERLRELCCIGDEINVKALVQKGVNINAANAMNGWTPLHWAAKRGHLSIVKYLVQEGVNAAALTYKGETAAKLSNDSGIRKLLGESDGTESSQASESLPIVPNYLRNPEFFYAEKVTFGKEDPRFRQQETTISNTWKHESSTDTNASVYSNCYAAHSEKEIVVKLRVADSEEKDFIEVDLDKSNLTFRFLVTIFCQELGIEANNIKKIRKLPNTIVRNDKDVKRLVPFQELEVVIKENVS